MSVALAIALSVACLAVVSSPSPVHALAVQHDPTFAAGSMAIDMRGTSDIGIGGEIDPAGRIVVGARSVRPASSALDAAFVRLTSSGAIDTTFGTGQNRVFVNLPESVRLLDFAVASDSKIVGLAEDGNDDRYVFRLNANGTLDTDTDTDPSTEFGNNGVLNLPTSAGFDSDILKELAVLPNGGVIVAGELELTTASSREVRVVGFTADGAFRFDTRVTVGVDDSTVEGLEINQTGTRAAIVTESENSAGRTIAGLLVIGTASGLPDTTFSGDGKLTRGSSTSDTLRPGVTFRFDGRIVLAAVETFATSTAIEDTLVVRYTTTGALDTTFDGDGVLRSTNPDIVNIRSVFITGTGRIFVVGSESTVPVAILALRPDGTRETGFDGDGAMLLVPPGDLSLSSAVPSSNGRTLLVGSTGTGSSDVGVVRLEATGQGHATFGNVAFREYTMSGGADRGNGIAVDPNGNVIVAGTSAFTSDRQFLLGLLPNGYRDPSFGFHGRANLIIGGPDKEARAVTVSGTRSVYAGCESCRSGASVFLVGRVTGLGERDTTFSTFGHQTTSFPGLDAHANGVAVQPDGKIVAVGHAGDDFAVVRYEFDGDPDPTFGGGDGIVTTDIATGSVDQAFDVAIQDNGGIIVVGERINASNARMAVVRYTAAGVPAGNFGGGDGIVVTNVGTDSGARGVAIRPDGRIIVAGSTVSGADEDVAIARYLTDGTLDTALDGDGKLIIGVSATLDDFALDVAAAGNRIVICGGVDQTNGQLVARFNGNGTPDTTFSDNGIEIGPFPSGPATALALTTDGSIVVAGLTEGGPSGDDTVVARYKP